jgi:hypothetical protein
MRVRALGALAVAAALIVAIACGPGGFFHPYEYEEEMYLSLDGSATLYVHSSLAALNALRGTTFETGPRARIDRDALRRYFETPVTHVHGNISTSRRSNRQFIHVRLDVPDVRRLHEAAPFAWSTYQFSGGETLDMYTQQVGGAVSAVSPPRRGNILVWEQSLAERLRGTPLTLEARMQTQSILYRTLWLFGATFVAVALSFGVLLWWILRRGEKAQSDLNV